MTSACFVVDAVFDGVIFAVVCRGFSVAVVVILCVVVAFAGVEVAAEDAVDDADNDEE